MEMLGRIAKRILSVLLLATMIITGMPGMTNSVKASDSPKKDVTICINKPNMVWDKNNILRLPIKDFELRDTVGNIIQMDSEDSPFNSLMYNVSMGPSDTFKLSFKPEFDTTIVHSATTNCYIPEPPYRKELVPIYDGEKYTITFGLDDFDITDYNPSATIDLNACRQQEVSIIDSPADVVTGRALYEMVDNTPSSRYDCVDITDRLIDGRFMLDPCKYYRYVPEYNNPDRIIVAKEEKTDWGYDWADESFKSQDALTFSSHINDSAVLDDTEVYFSAGMLSNYGAKSVKMFVRSDIASWSTLHVENFPDGVEIVEGESWLKISGNGDYSVNPRQNYQLVVQCPDTKKAPLLKYRVGDGEEIVPDYVISPIYDWEDEENPIITGYECTYNNIRNLDQDTTMSFELVDVCKINVEYSGDFAAPDHVELCTTDGEVLNSIYSYEDIDGIPEGKYSFHALKGTNVYLLDNRTFDYNVDRYFSFVKNGGDSFEHAPILYDGEVMNTLTKVPITGSAKLYYCEKPYELKIDYDNTIFNASVKYNGSGSDYAATHYSFKNDVLYYYGEPDNYDLILDPKCAASAWIYYSDGEYDMKEKSADGKYHFNMSEFYYGNKIKILGKKIASVNVAATEGIPSTAYSTKIDSDGLEDISDCILYVGDTARFYACVDTDYELKSISTTRDGSGRIDFCEDPDEEGYYYFDLYLAGANIPLYYEIEKRPDNYDVSFALDNSISSVGIYYDDMGEIVRRTIEATPTSSATVLSIPRGVDIAFENIAFSQEGDFTPRIVYRAGEDMPFTDAFDYKYGIYVNSNTEFHIGSAVKKDCTITFADYSEEDYTIQVDDRDSEKLGDVSGGKIVKSNSNYFTFYMPSVANNIILGEAYYTNSEGNNIPLSTGEGFDGHEYTYYIIGYIDEDITVHINKTPAYITQLSYPATMARSVGDYICSYFQDDSETKTTKDREFVFYLADEECENADFTVSEGFILNRGPYKVTASGERFATFTVSPESDDISMVPDVAVVSGKVPSTENVATVNMTYNDDETWQIQLLSDYKERSPEDGKYHRKKLEISDEGVVTVYSDYRTDLILAPLGNRIPTVTVDGEEIDYVYIANNQGGTKAYYYYDLGKVSKDSEHSVNIAYEKGSPSNYYGLTYARNEHVNFFSNQTDKLFEKGDTFDGDRASLSYSPYMVEKGDTVSFKVAADEGYSVEELRAGERVIPCTKFENGYYEYEFTAIEDTTVYVKTATDSNNPTVTFNYPIGMVGIFIENYAMPQNRKLQVSAGSTINFTVKPVNEKISIESVTANEEGALIYNSETDTYSLSVDRKNITINVGIGDADLGGDGDNPAAGSKDFTDDEQKAIIKNAGTIYALTNISKKLSAVSLPEGWTWDDAETILTADAKEQKFSATYKAEGYNAFTAQLPVVISEITDVSIDGKNVTASESTKSYVAVLTYGDFADLTEKFAKNITYEWTIDETLASLDVKNSNSVKLTAKDKAGDCALSVKVKVGSSELTDSCSVKIIVPSAEVPYEPVLDETVVTLHKDSTGTIVEFFTQNSNPIVGVKVLEGEKESTNFVAEVNDEESISLRLKSDSPYAKETRAKTYNVVFKLETEVGAYNVPGKIKVDVSKLKAQFKQTNKQNLFYKSASIATFDVTSAHQISDIELAASSKDIYSAEYEDGILYIYVKADITGSNYRNYANKTANLKIHYCDFNAIGEASVKVGTVYKKPVLLTDAKATFAGDTTFAVNVRDKATGEAINLNEKDFTITNRNIDSKIKFIGVENNAIKMTNVGLKTATYTYDLKSPRWAAPVTLSGKVTYSATPAAVLSNKQIVFNKPAMEKKMTYATEVKIKDSDINLKEITFTGKNPKTVKALEDGIIAVSANAIDKKLYVTYKSGSVGTGSYVINVSVKAGENNTESKKAALTVKLVNNTPAVAVKTSGALNILDDLSAITGKLTVKNSSADVIGATLKNNSSKFTLTISGNTIEIRKVAGASLNAGQRIPVTVSFTLSDGTVVDTIINVTPKSVLPKLKVSPAKGTLYRTSSKTFVQSITGANVAGKNYVIKSVERLSDRKHNEQYFDISYSCDGNVNISLSSKAATMNAGKYTVSYRVHLEGEDTSAKYVTLKAVVTVK